MVVGGGILQQDPQGRLLGKSAIVDYLHGLSRRFDRVLWATTVIPEEAGFRSKLDDQRVTVIGVGGRKGTLLSDLMSISRSLDGNTSVLLHLPNPWLMLAVLSCRYKYRGLVLYIANDFCAYADYAVKIRGPLYAKLYLWNYRVALKCSRGSIVRGRKNFEYVSKYCEKVIETIPLGHIESSAGGESVLRRERGRILYVGKLNRGKGVLILLDAFVELKRLRPDRHLELTIVGHGPVLGELKGLIKTLALEEDVHLLGYIDNPAELSALYRHSDVVVVPSIEPEGVPRVIDEALAIGRPVIATRVGGIVREFKSGEVLLVDPEDSRELARSLDRLIEDDQACQALIAAGQARNRILNRQKTASDQHADFIMTALRLV